MMQQGQWGGNQMMPQGQWGGNQTMPSNQMQQGHRLQPIVCPTQCRYNDSFFPVEQPYIHPIVNVNRQHPVITPRHYYTETTQNVMGAPINPGMGPTGVGPAGMGPGPGMGLGPAGMGPGYGGRGCCRKRY